jgi:acyl carrier protein
MNTDEIFESLQEIFKDLFDNDNLELTREMSSDDIEDWDSVAQISLVLTIENSLNVRISASELEELANVGDIVDLVNSKLN